MNFHTNAIFFLILLPWLGVFVLIIAWEFTIDTERKYIVVAFLFITFLLDFLLWIFFKSEPKIVQLFCSVSLKPLVDYFSYLVIRKTNNDIILLITVLIPIGFALNWDSKLSDSKLYLVSILMLESFLIGLMCPLDIYAILFFYKGTTVFTCIVLSVWIDNFQTWVSKFKNKS
nr:hypothetical protein [Stephanopyxis turris]